MQLGDQAYWLVQDDWNGGLRTAARAADVVVAAAVVAELVSLGAVELLPDRVFALQRSPGLDDLEAEVVAQIGAEPGVTVEEVIDGLAPSIRERVARRLIKSGAADERRVGWRRRRVAVAHDGDVGPAWVRASLATKLRRGLLLDEEEWVLLQLVRHSSMIGNPLAGIPAARAEQALQHRDLLIGRYEVLLRAAADAIRAAAVAR